MKVVYGHTDSIYVQIDSEGSLEEKVNKSKEIAEMIQDEVRKAFPNVLGLEQHPVVLEFEKFFSALGVGTTKNRNAGMIGWEDGVFLEEEKFTMTGFTAKRVSETKLAKSIQTDALKMWVNNKSQKEMIGHLNKIYTDVRNGNVELSSLIKRTRIKENRFVVRCRECKKKYHVKECLKLDYCSKCGEDTSKFVTVEWKKPSFGSGVAGVLYCWEHLNQTFDDSYLFLKVKHLPNTFTHPLTKEQKVAEYISGITYADFEEYVPDYEHYAEQVLSKADPIFRAMGWDLSSIRTGRIQQSLEEWF
jgi:DNA polymerase elongation subunit (family B)